ncbi:hypothetical protein SUGI_0069100 [Cryptomeria japonica]|nr:hypothetical protein SUGI_0069100 [Cryptomeria japonica]
MPLQKEIVKKGNGFKIIKKELKTLTTQRRNFDIYVKDEGIFKTPRSGYRRRRHASWQTRLAVHFSHIIAQSEPNFKACFVRRDSNTRPQEKNRVAYRTWICASFNFVVASVPVKCREISGKKRGPVLLAQRRSFSSASLVALGEEEGENEREERENKTGSFQHNIGNFCCGSGRD